jgi:hypothetical protein
MSIHPMTNVVSFIILLFFQIFKSCATWEFKTGTKLVMSEKVVSHQDEGS